MNIVPRLLARKSTEPMTRSEPETPSEAHRLAAAVRRPGKHQLAERTLAGIRDKAAELRQRLIDLRIAANAGNAAATDRALKALIADQAANDQALRECRAELAPMRAEHAARVERELRPLREAAAGKVAAAAIALRAALAELNIANDAARMYGVDAPSVRVDGLDGLDDALRGL